MVECHPGWAGAFAPHRYDRCVGQVHLANRTGCAKSFKENKDGNPWKAHVGLSELHGSSCLSLVVSCVDSANHMAHVGCEDGERSEKFVINADDLDCVAGNVSTYAKPLPAWTQAANCPEAQLASLPLTSSTLAAGQFVPNALQRCVINAAKNKYQEVQMKVQGQDQYKLFDIYDGMSHTQLRTALIRARTRLLERSLRAFNLFGPECDKEPKIAKGSGVLETDIPQGQRTCRLISEAAMLANHLDPEVLTPAEAHHRFLEESNNFAQSHDLAGFDENAFRTIMFEGLSDARQTEVYGKLNMKRKAGEFQRLEKASGPWALGEFVELHNGYVFGGSRMSGDKNSIDCSDFISSVYGLKEQVVDDNGHKTNRVPSTLQLQQIARYVSKESKSPPPAPWNKYVSCFQSVNLRGGERPQPGDVVVQRANGEGHVVLVEAYDAEKSPDTVKTIEAFGGGMGTLGPNSRPLFDPRCNNADSDDQPAVRSDITVIRFIGGNGCPAHPNEKACASD